MGVNNFSNTLSELLPEGLDKHPVRFFLFFWPVVGGLGLLFLTGEEDSWIVSLLDRFGATSSQYIIAGCLLMFAGASVVISIVWVIWLHVSSKTWDGSSN